MKTLTIKEAQSQLGRLIAEANRGDVIALTDGAQKVLLQPGAALDLEEDSPELEAELLKTVDGPYTPYSSEEMRSLVERIAQNPSKHVASPSMRTIFRLTALFVALVTLVLWLFGGPNSGFPKTSSEAIQDVAAKCMPIGN
jgi:hypothetical protein